ncbi:MAG TPA: citramalate synthase [Acidimicrobiia bacterium]|nr:citramalate synthase [Acidimicrobiia bacterium]
MLEIYDTTLRDGMQREGLSPTARDKLEIARQLDRLGVAYIEGGWPGANPKDDEFFALAAKELQLENAVLTAFGSTCRVGADPATDDQIAVLLAAETAVICIVGKSWDYHVTEALRTDLDEAVRMVGDSITYIRSQGRRAMFDAEHFFDGYKANPEFALRVARAAHEAGAERVILCDTNGGTLPDESRRIVEEVMAAIPEAGIGVHFHNDGGCAVANSLAAVEAGVHQVQGCVNGYGERTGNADLCTVIPNLVLKMGHDVVTEEQLARLAPIAHHVAEITNTAIDPHHPYVGSAAFSHKAGLHTSAIARRSDAYEHVDPSRVGNSAKMLVSELMGRATVLTRAKEAGWTLSPEQAQDVVDRVKELEHKGYLFEAADGSFELMLREIMGEQPTFFTVESFRSFQELRPDGDVLAEATVKVLVGEERFIVTSEGDGPVNALDRALRKALGPAYPEIDGFRLTDYRVRDLDSGDGTAARVRVLIEHSDDGGSWSTIGVHPNIIEASWEALVSGVVLGLLRARD